MTDKEKDSNIKDNNLSQEVDSRFLKFVNLKSKKLVQAVYLVTSFISDSEPLKWRLRDSALEFLSDTSLLIPANSLSGGVSEASQISPLFKISVLESVLNRSEQMQGLFDVALAANFASEMNFSILKNEFAQLQKNISLRLGKGLKEIVGSEGVGQFLLGDQEKYPFGSQTVPMGHLLNENSPKENFMSERFQKRSADSIKDSLPSGRELAPSRRVSNKDSRRNEIIAFLKGKSWTPIKDISDAISGCSTKTIQRELSDLVQAGVLKKKGDRRWSRYLLA